MRILLAVDGSPSSHQARDLVASLPWPPAASVTLLAAFDIPIAWFTEGAVIASDWLSEAEDAIRHEAEGALATMAQPLEGRGWSIERRVVRGRPAGVILATADELDADLIVLGSRGHGTIGSMLLGSVSAEVADHARCSVLVARAPTVSRLLVATDGSDGAAVIPAVLADWAVFQDMPSIALSVAPIGSPAYELLVRIYTLGSLSTDDGRDELVERYRGYAAEMAERLTVAGLPARAQSRSGDAAHEILHVVAEAGADLVVVGSRSLHGLDRWLLGSVARNVLSHTTASVLIVRGKPPPAGS